MILLFGNFGRIAVLATDPKISTGNTERNETKVSTTEILYQVFSAELCEFFAFFAVRIDTLTAKYAKNSQSFASRNL